MLKKQSSEIKRTPLREAVKLRLWGMAAGRCEICNKLLYLDSYYHAFVDAVLRLAECSARHF